MDVMKLGRHEADQVFFSPVLPRVGSKAGQTQIKEGSLFNKLALAVNVSFATNQIHSNDVIFPFSSYCNAL